ncbi:MAG: proton-conducting transporter membrane subunit [Coriobacteriaceae bacterium]
MFTGWEVTTLCSFLLIGYTRTEEAIANAFRQIIMNLAGGLGFLVALWCCALTVGTFSFYEFLVIGQNNPALTTLAVTALAFAGITKAAQMPFQTWLLGAMVAPTPTSALLHSSTMVKAGVFLLVKLAPVFHVSPAPAVMVMLVGGITFALCSFMAISQSNAKRVLAYSTIANLGLITACAGVGTAEAVWAASSSSVPCHREVASVPVRRHGRAPHRQPRHRVHGPSVRPHAAPGPLHDARHHVHVHRALRHAARQVGHARVFRGHPPGRPHHHLGLRQRRHVHVLGQMARQALRHRRRAGERGDHGEADGMGGAASYGLPARAGLRVPAAHLLDARRALRGQRLRHARPGYRHGQPVARLHLHRYRGGRAVRRPRIEAEVASGERLSGRHQPRQRLPRLPELAVGHH